MTAAELRFEVLRLAAMRQGANDPRDLYRIADEMFAWCADPQAVAQVNAVNRMPVMVPAPEIPVPGPMKGKKAGGS